MRIKYQIAVLAILSVIILVSVYAQTSLETKIETGKENLEEKIANTTEALKNLKDESKWDYKFKAWADLAKKTKVFQKLSEYNKVFRFLIGQELDISWKFLAGAAIWAVLLVIYLGSLDMVFSDNKFFVWSIGIIMSALTSQLAVPLIIDKVVAFLKKGTEKAVQWFDIGTIILSVIAIFLLKRLFKVLKKKLAERRLKKRVVRAEEAVTAVGKSLEKAENVKKGMEEAEGKS